MPRLGGQSGRVDPERQRPCAAAAVWRDRFPGLTIRTTEMYYCSKYVTKSFGDWDLSDNLQAFMRRCRFLARPSAKNCRRLQ